MANDRVIMARERGESLKHVLFVCTGNTCRSPMAEALLRQMAKEEGLDIDVKSAGISAIEGTTASRYAIEALQEKGIVLDHQSKAVDQELVHWADIILTMTQSHKQALIHHFPDSVDKIFLIKEYGQDNPKIERIYQQLDQLHIEMEEKRAKVQADFLKQKGESWSPEAEEAWIQLIQPLLEKEKDLINQLDRFTFNQDVVDPFGGNLEEYRRCLQDLESSIRQVIAKWK